MHSRPIRSISFVVLVFMSFMLLSSTIAQAHPLALQSDDQDSEGQSAVEGNSYTSPDFGFSVNWDRSWSVTDEENSSDYNMVAISNEVAFVYFEGQTASVDTDSCVQEYENILEGIDNVSNVELAKNLDGPDVDNSVERSWALYTYSYAEGNDDPVEFAYYVDCRSLVEGESILVITMVSALDFLDSQLDPLSDLLASVALDGSTGSAPEDDGNDTGDSGSANGDLANFIEISGRDINNFWTREFPLISGGKAYTPPADIVSFDETIETDCGDAAPMEVGPFYCPPDQKIYYDLVFAQMQLDLYENQSVIAVVMAHEIGHHIQALMGWNECLATPCLDPSELTSQEFELMADCFAGAWVADAETRGRMGSFDVETNITQFARLLGDDAGNNADAGAHGTAARRTYMFLSGYFGGVTECLKYSAATDPARNGGANANTNTGSTGTEDTTPEATAEATKETNTTELIAVGDEFRIELPNATLAMTITEVDTTDTLGGGRDAEGQFIVVYFSLERDAEAAGPFPYDSFILVDKDDNEYDVDGSSTDAYLKTSEDFPNGVEEDINAGTTYNLAIVFDVPTDGSGFVFGTADGNFQVDLEV